MADTSGESAMPKTWREAIPYIVWVVLVLGFGLEFTTALVHWELLHALVSFAFMAGVAAMMLHWRQIKTWLGVRNPAWVVAGAFIVLSALILSPFVEQQRWPFDWWSHLSNPSPGADAIARAVASEQQLKTDLANAEETIKKLTADLQKEKAARAAGLPIETPIDVAVLPTSLRALFKHNGPPETIGNKNLTWTWLRPEERLKNPKYVPPPPAPSQLGTLASPLLFPTQPTEPEYIETSTWMIILIFDHPISYKSIKIDDHGTNLPAPEIWHKDRYAIIWFHSYIDSTLIDIAASND